MAGAPGGATAGLSGTPAGNGWRGPETSGAVRLTGAAGTGGAGTAGMPGGRMAGAEAAGAGAEASGGLGGAAGLERGGMGIEGTPVRAPASGGRMGCGEPDACKGGVSGVPPPKEEGAGGGSSAAAVRGVSLGIGVSAGTGAASALAVTSSSDSALGFSDVFLGDGLSGSAVFPNRWRTTSANSSSSELECVFFSPTPSSGNRSIITLGLTSSSLANSLMRILLISPVRSGFRSRHPTPSSPHAH
jgi:hypothetical protein